MKTTTTTALRLLAVLFIFCLFAPMAAGQDASATDSNWDGTVADKIANVEDGDGTSWKTPILIASAEELAYFAKQVNNRLSITYGSGDAQIEPDGNFEDIYFALSANIDLSAYYWTPIGTGSNPFNGNFDGQGHCVSGLKVNGNGYTDVYAGLFGNAVFSTLQNLGVRLAEEGVRATNTDPMGGNLYAGGIAGQALNVHNCYVVGEGSIEITGEGSVKAGGIVGYLFDSGSLTNCYATVDIRIETEGIRHAGGIVGYCNFNSTISCTYATGDVETGTGEMYFYAGGICGYLNSGATIENSLALNGRIAGGSSFSNRIVGEEGGSTTLTANYASPVILVNGNPVSDGAEGDKNGDPSITFNNLQKTLEDKWQAAWTFPDGGYLPQLMLTDGEGNYTNWPKASPQPFIDPVASLPGSIANAGGNGSNGSPILIANRAELAYFAKQVNKGEPIKYGNDNDQIEPIGKNAAGGFSGYYFALSADIDLEKHYWTPIGINNKPFKGHFDGRGHCVSGLKVDVNGNGNVYAGLFGNADVATIQNLGVRLAEAGIRAHATNANSYAGGIAGKAKNIHNCYVEGPGTVEAYATSNDLSKTPSSYAGGIVGYLPFFSPFPSSLTHCYAMVDVKAEGAVNNHAGGIAGVANGSLSFTYATGAVEAAGNTANNYAGGICGFAYTGSSLLNNLALNKSIKGKEGESNRIVGNKESNVTLASNYASPEIQVNGKFVDAGADGDMNGDPEVNLGNFGTVIKWGDSWDTTDKTHLPKLKMRMGDGPGYNNWPTGEGFTPQSPPDATLYLIADKIANAGSGNGSNGSPILIANRAELAYFAKQVNSKQSITLGNGGGSIGPKDNGGAGGFIDYYFALSANIDLSAYYWTPIGTDNPFKGNFDGQGHCVSGLKVDVNGNSNVYVGLFGSTYLGTIQNLGVRLAKEGVRGTVNQGAIYAGGIAGQALNVHNCYVVGEGSIEINSEGEGNGYAGGIVGYLFDSGSLTNCYATVDIMIETKGTRYAGGIVGYCNFNSTISCTYATGDVEAGTGKMNFYAGGICGYLNSEATIENSLALNGQIAGGSSFSNRIVGEEGKGTTLTTNYASPMILVNDKTSTDNLVDNKNGANTWLSSFQDDLKSASGVANGWVESWDFSADNLPQLKKKTADGYEAWGSKQPQLKANLYLPSRLYIVSPIGGTLTVTDKADNPLTDGSAVMSGTQLNLTYAESGNYRFSGYLSGSDKDNLKSYDSNPITMPDADLYLSATFTYQEPTPPYVPPVPVYYSVYLPQVEGASTDPGPGEHEVESWDDFRFYLTLDSAYSESQPVVTTDRGETLVPRSSDGAYLVKYVRSDVEVFIDGIFKNLPPVANEAIGTDGLAPQIWSEGSMLCIRMPEALPSTPVSIYTTDGRLHNSFASTPGLNRRQLPTGIYIVRVGETVRKVAIRK